MTLNQSKTMYQFQIQARREYEDLITPIILLIKELLGTYAVYPVERLPRLLKEVNSEINGLFLSRNRVFTFEGTPVSPFAIMLSPILLDVQKPVLEAHRRFYRANLSPGVVQALSEDSRGSFEQAHEWRNEKDRNLNDRIIAVLVILLQKLHRFLTTSVIRGDRTTAIMSDLDKLSSFRRRTPLSTNLQGLDLTFEVSRLLRNEVARMYTNAVFTLAAVNALSVGIEWALSPRHPQRDICDGLATIGMSGERLRETYPVDTAPRVVADSHVNCICVNYSSDEINPDEVEKLQNGMSSISPLSSGYSL